MTATHRVRFIHPFHPTPATRPWDLGEEVDVREREGAAGENRWYHAGSDSVIPDWCVTVVRDFIAEKEEPTRKASNPKDAIGSRKLPWHVFPMRVLAGVIHAFVEGALKYGSFNYRAVGVRATVYTDGAMRHISRFLEGEDYDPEVTGYADGVRIHHLDKAIASLVVLRDSMLRGNWTDDRPPASEEWMTEANRMTALLIDSVPSPVAPFTQARVASGEFRDPSIPPRPKKD